MTACACFHPFFIEIPNPSYEISMKNAFPALIPLVLLGDRSLVPVYHAAAFRRGDQLIDACREEEQPGRCGEMHEELKKGASS